MAGEAKPSGTRSLLIGTYRAKTARASLFSVLAKHKTADQTLDAVARLRRHWAARVKSLAEAGLPALASPAAQIMAKGCAPSGVITPQRLRPCGHRTVCPFCWSRLAQDLATTLSDRLYVQRGEKVYQRPYVHLVEASLSYLYDPCDVQQIMTDLAGVPARAFAELRTPKAYGSIVVTSMAPNGDKGGWAVIHRLLSIMPQSKPNRTVVAAQAATKLEWGERRQAAKRWRKFTKRDLVGIVGRTYQYPPGLLFAPAETVVELLAARQQTQRHGSRRFGVLRNGTKISLPPLAERPPAEPQ